MHPAFRQNAELNPPFTAVNNTEAVQISLELVVTNTRATAAELKEVLE